MYMSCVKVSVVLKSDDRCVEEKSEASIKDTEITCIHIYAKVAKLYLGFHVLTHFFNYLSVSS